MTSMHISAKAAKVADGDVDRSRMLCSLREAGYQLAEVPFSPLEMACWQRKEEADSMSLTDLLCAIKVGPQTSLPLCIWRTQEPW